VHDTATDLLVRYIEHGQVIREPDALAIARERARTELAMLSPRTRRFMNPQPYPVGLDNRVHVKKQQLIARARHGHA
jgi:nicotinate phosphoribosyltransferase